MRLNEEQRSAVKSSAKQLLEVQKKKTKELDATMLLSYVNRALSFLGLESDDEDIKDLVHDLEYEVSVRHTAENGGYPPTPNGDIRSLF